jgi:hypothetical protein
MISEAVSLALADPLDLFRERVLADPALEHALAGIEDRDAFAVTARKMAARLDLTLDADTLNAALRPDPIGLDRFDDRPAEKGDVPGRGWLPTAVASAAGAMALDWTHFAGARLTEPFFEDSLRRARRLPFNRLIRRRTPLSDLAEAMEGEAPVVPDGLIFHLSRCGSTLVAQMLAAVDEHVVVSEAPPLDAVVQLAQQRTKVPLAERVRLLRAMVSALGRDRATGGRYIVKLDSWHALALPLFRLAFPDTPWVFLYRDPVEIMVSHGRSRGWQTVQGAMGDLYGIADGGRMSGEDYTARVLARTCEAVLRHHMLGGGMLIDYRMLPAAVETRILPHFGISPNTTGREAMAAAAARDAKTPAFPFARDVERKQQEAGPGLRALVAAHLAGPYRRLEALRQAAT